MELEFSQHIFEK